MESEEAIKLIDELVGRVIRATQEGMTRRRGVTKISIKEVDQSISRVFQLLTGRKPTKDEIKRMTD